MRGAGLRWCSRLNDGPSFAELLALGARRLGVFGSFGRGEARADRDVDIYFEFDEGKRTYDNFFDLHVLLENLLGRRVDPRDGQVAH